MCLIFRTSSGFENVHTTREDKTTAIDESGDLEIDDETEMI